MLIPAIDFGPDLVGETWAPIGVYDGWKCLVWGWLGCLKGDPSWLANPLLLIGWVILGRWPGVVGIVVSLIALSLGVLYLIFSDEGRSPLIGAYFWVGSIGVLLIGATTGWRAIRFPRLA